MKRSENLHFMKCANTFCGMYHLVKADGKLTIDAMLCTKCRELKTKSHCIQCISCGAIVDFIPLSENEMPATLYVKQCMDCGGTLEDELKILDGYNPEFLVS